METKRREADGSNEFFNFDSPIIQKEREKKEENRWIPTKEKLPEEYGQYICTLKGEYDTGEPRECGFVPYGIKELIGGWSTCNADGFVRIDKQDVIAWMPIPTPYSPDGEKGEEDDR